MDGQRNRSHRHLGWTGFVATQRRCQPSVKRIETAGRLSRRSQGAAEVQATSVGLIEVGDIEAAVSLAKVPAHVHVAGGGIGRPTLVAEIVGDDCWRRYRSRCPNSRRCP